MVVSVGLVYVSYFHNVPWCLMEMNQSRPHCATPGEWHSHHNLWCFMELHSAQPRQPWVVALIASHQTGPWGAWVCAVGRRPCLLQGQWWKTLASMGQSSRCVIMGWGLYHLSSLKEAGEGNIRGLWVWVRLTSNPKGGWVSWVHSLAYNFLESVLALSGQEGRVFFFKVLIKNNLVAP